jgi:ribosomal protein S4
LSKDKFKTLIHNHFQKQNKMARYTGPKTKIARKFGVAIFGEDKSFEKRNYPPGQHGNNRRRGKKSEYAIQLMEKQKAKYTYGVLEKQFRNMFKKATASKGITGEVLLQLCESRLDNVVFRMGLSRSRSGARQLVSHRHITVNGGIVNIPSYSLKAGDIIKSFDIIPDEVLRVEVNNQSVGDYLKQGLDLEDATNAAVEIKDKAGKVIKTIDDFKFWGSGA